MNTSDVNNVITTLEDNLRLRHLVKTFFDTYLNRVEESEGGRLFFPIVISNCRAATIAPLNDLLDEMAKLSGANPRPDIDKGDW